MISQSVFGVESRTVSNLIVAPFDKQSSALSADAPFTSIAQGESGEIWLSGKTNLWKWHPDLASLKKVELNSEGKGQVFSYGKDSVIYKTDSKVYLVYDNPSSIKELHSGNFTSIAVSPFGEILIAGEESFILSFDLKNKSAIEFDLSGCQSIKDFDAQTWLCVSRYSVKKYQLKQPKPTLVIDSKSPVKGSISLTNGYLTAGEKVLWITNSTGALVKTIVPSQDRKIAASFLNQEKHMYLFSDRLLEINDAKNGDKVLTWLQGPKARSVGEMNFKDGRLAIILDGQPHLFQLDKNWK